ncbi:hypothetical protein [Salinibacterium sp. SWN167]|uniref:hypothetical protein n=1 Tax=Salinibacterium sp. SWN167 TaxID=2792054 RepID=UPI0018CF1C36|nr:hypothetical protein [Salinibacterium sp. SWN167]MBH0084186.1 hypothetical protein [Salinibacterium sp. SWN167]
MLSFPWFVVDDEGFPTGEFDRDRLEMLRCAPLPDQRDLDAALTLLDAIGEWVEGWEDGTSDEGRRLTEDALRTLQIVCARVGLDIDVTSNLDVSGGRRRSYEVWDMLRPAHDALLAYERYELARQLEDTGWPAIRVEIEELRRAWRQANTPQGYSSVGNHAVRVLETLSDAVGAQGIPINQTKNRLLGFLDERAGGSANGDLKKVVQHAFDLAHGVKHDRDPDRLKAGSAASAAIMIVSMLWSAHEQR